MIVENMKIVEQQQLTVDIYQCCLEGELVNMIQKPGQFINIKIAGHFLRRPISIARYDVKQKRLWIIYKIIGEGLHSLSEYPNGSYLDILGPLGNGFDLQPLSEKQERHIAIFGGGIGIPPLAGLVEAISNAFPKVRICCYLGYQNAADVFKMDAFIANADVHYFTMDGGMGTKGNILSLTEYPEFAYYFACGPMKMLAAVEKKFPNVSGQLSQEARMACGIGVCMGCVMSTKKGYQRVCYEGPVFAHEVVNYE